MSTIPKRLQVLLNIYDEGNLPPDEQIEMAQFLIDCDLHNDLLQYQQLCDYFIAEGMCYDCLLYTSPSPRDKRQSRMPSSA